MNQAIKKLMKRNKFLSELRKVKQEAATHYGEEIYNEDDPEILQQILDNIHFEKKQIDIFKSIFLHQVSDDKAKAKALFCSPAFQWTELKDILENNYNPFLLNLLNKMIEEFAQEKL